MGNLLIREIKKSAISILLKLFIQATVCVGIAICFLYLTTIVGTIDEFITNEQWGGFLASASADIKQLDDLGIEGAHIYYASGADEAEVELRSGGKTGTIKANECIFYSANDITATSFFRKIGGFYEISETKEHDENQVILSADLAEYAGIIVGDLINIQYRGVETTLTISSTFFCDGDKYSLILPCAGIEQWAETDSNSLIGSLAPTVHLLTLEKIKKKGIACQDLSGLIAVRERTTSVLWILSAILLMCVLLTVAIQWRQSKQLLRDREKHIEILYMCGYSLRKVSLLYVMILALFHILMSLVVGGVFSASVYYINHVLEEFFVLTQSFWQKTAAILFSMGIPLLIDILSGTWLYRKMRKQYAA